MTDVNSFDISELKAKAIDTRLTILEITTKAGSGHVSSSYSSVEILLALFFGGILKYRASDPEWDERDRFIMSKGHAAPLLYTVLADAGYFEKEMIYTLRQAGSPVQGHPIYKLMPGVEATTGSLGQGISLALGQIFASRLSGIDFRSYVLLGDGELQAGQIWEAAMAAAHHKADRLIAILDYNKFQETGPISRELALEPLVDKWESFGWEVFEADGHDVEDVIAKLQAAQTLNQKPKLIIAHTVKGKGVSFVEADYTFHGRALKGEQATSARQELIAAKEQLDATR